LGSGQPTFFFFLKKKTENNKLNWLTRTSQPT